MSDTLEAGFDDPVLEAQKAFRAIMDALSRPGTLQPLALPTAPPAPLTPELAAVALTLCDHDTPVWLDPRLAASDAVREWIAFHTGAPIAERTAGAAFALVSDATLLPPLAEFALGTDEYPDRSITIALAAAALDGGAPLVLKGPGIKNEASVAPIGLPRGFAAQWADNRAQFPRGVDLLLLAGGRVIGLPRTTRVGG